MVAALFAWRRYALVAGVGVGRVEVGVPSGAGGEQVAGGACAAPVRSGASA